MLLEDLGHDGDGRVNGIGNDEDERARAVLGNTLGQAGDNASVDLHLQVPRWLFVQLSPVSSSLFPCWCLRGNHPNKMQ